MASNGDILLSSWKLEKRKWFRLIIEWWYITKFPPYLQPASETYEELDSFKGD